MFGDAALASNANGSGNTAVGDAALVSSVGSDNTALGALAGHNATTGSGNVYIGAAIQPGLTKLEAVNGGECFGSPARKRTCRLAVF